MRLDHWDAHLVAFLHSRAKSPFTWTGNDCCLFAADAIQAMTSIDIAADFRGAYTTEKRAFATIRRITGADGVEAALTYVATKHSMPEVPPLTAMRGDLLLIQSGQSIAGIVGMDGYAWCVGQSGLHRLPITAALKAWRV